MSAGVEVAITLAVGVAGGWLAIRLRLPGGALFGSLIAVAVMHIGLPTLEPLPNFIRTAAQIAIGGVIGATLTRSPLRAVRELGWPVVLMFVLMVGSAVLMAAMMAKASGLPIVTAFFSFAPGGASDLAGAALQLDADVGLIASIHVVRQLAVFVILTAAFSHFLRPHGIDPEEPGDAEGQDGR